MITTSFSTRRWLLRLASTERITTLVFALGALAIVSGLVGILFGASAGAAGS